MEEQSSNSSLDKQEERIAKELNDLCNEKGEVLEKDVTKSGDKLYQLGQVYRKRFLDKLDKLALIKSVGLLNAALLRKPSNATKVKEELNSLCKEILEKANAEDSKADLLEKAKTLNAEIKKWRKEVEIQLHEMQKSEENTDQQELKKIKHIKELQEQISAEYINFMASIAKYCENVMGEAPCNCKYVVAGMGSLAKKEITPFSDFEHIIVLEEINDQILEHFRWYSVIFHVIVLNLQETIVPNLDIDSLNDKEDNFKSWFYDSVTPCGISFDGMMPHASKYPLGKKETKNKPSNELIKPVSQMLKYLTSEEDLKSGYHLKDILTKTCFVFGDETVYDEFNKGVEKQQNLLKDIKRQVEEDVNCFATKFKLSAITRENKFHIKKTVYRSSTLFVSAIGRIHKIQKSSSFEIIEDLFDDGVISEYAKHKLMYAVALACKIRLELYFDSNSQQDYVNMTDKREKFLELFGTTDLIKYFQISYCLQIEACKKVNLKTNNFYFYPKLLNYIICNVFELDELLNQLLIENVCLLEALDYSTNDNQQLNFDESLKLLEKQTNALPSSSQIVDWDSYKNFYKAFNFFYIGIILYFLKKVDDASEFLKYFANTLKKETNIGSDFDNNEVVRKVLEKIEQQVQKLSLDKNSQIHRKNFIYDFLQRNFPNEKNTTNITRMLDLAAFYFYELEQFQNSLDCCEQALEIYEKLSADSKKDKNVALVHDNIGMCLQEVEGYEKALEHHEKALEIYIATLEDSDKKMARVHENIGDCYHEVKDYEKALSYHKKALLYYITIDTTLSMVSEYFEDIARALDNIGECLKELKQHEEAITNHQSAYRVYSNLPQYHPDREEGIARVSENIGDCKHDYGDCEEALKNYEKALLHYKNLPENSDKDESIARVLDSMGESYQKLTRYDEALNKHVEARDIYQKLNCTKKISGVYKNIGDCYKNKENYKEALKQYKDALQGYINIFKKEGLHKDKIGTVCINIRECYRIMGQCDEAERYLKQTFEFQPELLLLVHTDPSVDDDKSDDVIDVTDDGDKVSNE